ncbi:restriction endonuclease [Bacillus sp. LL01]|uniref:restriction endonuclease n=1 Tax=Bacillus sp. LL01 TaxID=1665556 RepID=UPI00069FCC36|nr:restriction endonuclease [Bacillus sp. LL01]
MSRRKKRRSKKYAPERIMYFFIIIVVLNALAKADSIKYVFLALLNLGIMLLVIKLFAKPAFRYWKARQYIFSGVEETDSLSGHEFEHYLAPVFERYGYRAEVTQASGEYGADLILRKKGKKTVVQAKCYGEGKKIGVKAVQEVVGAKGYYGATYAMVVTNQYFTKQAENLAKANGVKLVDRSELASMLYACNARRGVTVDVNG